MIGSNAVILNPPIHRRTNYIVSYSNSLRFEEFDKSVKITGGITRTLVDFRENSMTLKIPRGWTTRDAAKDIHDVLVNSFKSLGTSTLKIHYGNKTVFECSMKKDHFTHSYKKLKSRDRQFLKYLALEIRRTMLSEAIVEKKINLI